MDKFLCDDLSIVVRPCDDFHTCYEFTQELREHCLIDAVLRHCCHCTDCKVKCFNLMEDNNNVS